MPATDSSRPELVAEIRAEMARVGGKILGVVLNGVRVTAGGYLQKNYETFYEYHSQAPESPKTQLTMK